MVVRCEKHRGGLSRRRRSKHRIRTAKNKKKIRKLE
ncbi:hypothetical protein NMG60_11006520 [Bertholletia excelsa]